jgi:hypothetical protein
MFLEKPCEHDKTTHLRVLKDDLTKLMSIKNGAGFKSLAWVVHSLLEQQANSIVTIEAVMNGNVPTVLTGKPLSGKTSFIKQKLLPSLRGNPVLVIDSWDEYKELRNICYDIYGLDFANFSDHIRFVPNSQSKVAETEVESIFAHLDMKRNAMSKWTIIVEEAHTFRNVSSFVKFLYGSRHIVRKMVAITPQTDAFQGLVIMAVCRRIP